MGSLYEMASSDPEKYRRLSRETFQQVRSQNRALMRACTVLIFAGVGLAALCLVIVPGASKMILGSMSLMLPLWAAAYLIDRKVRQQDGYSRMMGLVSAQAYRRLALRRVGWNLGQYMVAWLATVVIAHHLESRMMSGDALGGYGVVLYMVLATMVTLWSAWSGFGMMSTTIDIVQDKTGYKRGV